MCLKFNTFEYGYFLKNKMMRKLFFLASLACSLSMGAQITITSADMPNAGDSVRISYTATLDSNDVTLSGANRTWDYSALVPDMQRFEKFDSPFTFPSPFNLLFNPLNTSYGNENNILTSLPIPGLTLDMAYDFLKESSSKFEQVGAGYTINGAPMPFVYTDKDVIYRFPMNYFDADTGDYKFGLPIPTIGYYGQSGHRETFVDGWGTLITPYDTFSVLRVYSTIATVDTLYLDAFGFGTYIPRPLRYEFKWLANGEQIPVLKVDATDVAGTLTVNNIEWIDSLQNVPQLGIASHSSSDFNSSVYPNPSVDHSIIQYTLEKSERVKIILTDLTGRVVLNLANEMQSVGTHKQQLDVAGLSNGMYLVLLQTDTGQATHRLTISK